MPLNIHQIPALYDGISQQPPNLRLPSQAEVMINGWSTVVQGLMKRPSTQHVAQLSSGDMSSSFMYIINYTTTQRYILVLAEGVIQVYDMAGNACSVVTTHDQGYLYRGGYNPVTWTSTLNGATTFKNDLGHFVVPTVANGFVYKVVGNTGGAGGTTQPTWPTTLGNTVVSGGLTYQCYAPYSGTFSAQADFAAVTIEGTTIIVNKTCSVAMELAGSDLSQGPFYTALGTTPGDKYQLWNGVETAAHGPNPTNLSPGGLGWWTAQSFQTLPGVDSTVDFPNPSSPNGTLYKISGDNSNSFASYFVTYQSGVWNETCSPSNDQGTAGLPNVIDPLSMPWALSPTNVIDGNGNPQFVFQPVMWEPRRAGDDITNPDPSFVGSTINDVFTYQNRLGFCAGPNCIMSQAGQYNNFFRLTVTQTLADQVIDTGSSDNELTEFFFGVPFATGMMLFSSEAQIRLVQPYDGNLSSTTAALQVATRFVNSTTVRPIMLGTDIYFVSEDDTYAHIREYFVLMNYMGQYQMDATDISAHVPKYVPKGALFLTGSLIHNSLFLATSANQQLLYVYGFYWQSQQQKSMAAWHHWDFGPGAKVCSAFALDDYLWLVVKREDGATYLEKMSLAIGANVGLADSNGNLFDILLDRRCQVTGVYLSASNTTTFTFPYAPYFSYLNMVNASNGAQLSTTGGTVSGNTLTLPGNQAGTYFAGYQYTFTYQFSQQFQMNSNNVAILSGRLQLRNWRVYYSYATVFQVSVDPYGVSPNVVTYVPGNQTTYSATTTGETALGEPNFQAGMFEIGVFGESKEAKVKLINDTPYPSIFQEAEWEGEYTNRARAT